MKLLFVCRGNVARSQMAEEFFRRLSGGNFEVTSAGTKLSGPEQPLKELPLAEVLIECMNEVGIDVSNNLRKPITPEIANEVDKIILVMDENDFVPEYLMNNSKVSHWMILDPKGKDLDFHRRVRDQIKLKVVELVAELSK